MPIQKNQEVIINNAVVEYLNYLGFSSVVTQFKDELNKKKEAKTGKASSDGPKSEASKHRLVAIAQEMFESGDGVKFNEAIESVFPKQELAQSQHQLLFLHLHVYFAIHPLLTLRTRERKARKAKVEAAKLKMAEPMGRLKAYLAEHKAIAQSSQHLAYFGLPFVSEPDTHPSFKHLFQPDWLNRLKEDLNNFFKNGIGPSRRPRLFNYYQAFRDNKHPSGKARGKGVGGSGTSASESSSQSTKRASVGSRLSGASTASTRRKTNKKERGSRVGRNAGSHQNNSSNRSLVDKEQLREWLQELLGLGLELFQELAEASKYANHGFELYGFLSEAKDRLCKCNEDLAQCKDASLSKVAFNLEGDVMAIPQPGAAMRVQPPVMGGSLAQAKGGQVTGSNIVTPVSSSVFSPNAAGFTGPSSSSSSAGATVGASLPYSHGQSSGISRVPGSPLNFRSLSSAGSYGPTRGGGTPLVPIGEHANEDLSPGRDDPDVDHRYGGNINMNDNQGNQQTGVNNSNRTATEVDSHGYTQVLLAPLDYYKIKSDLWVQNHQRAVILQALRWRLTRPQNANQRRNIVHQFIQSDFLDCAATATSSGGGKTAAAAAAAAGDLLTSLLSLQENNIYVCEATCRLINSLASYAVGRKYLLQHPDILQLLFNVLRYADSDQFNDIPLVQHALISLQKFSLRRQPQSKMIKMGVIGWVVDNVLKHADPKMEGKDGVPPLSEYTQEYGTALLMNLSLRTAGRIACEDPQLNILKALKQLLSHPNLQVRTYINGSLYSILSRPALQRRAQNMALSDTLLSVRSRTEEPLVRQIDCILQQLETDHSEEKASVSDDESQDDDDNDDEADEEAEDDAEIDEDELAYAKIPHISASRGEQLLCERYLADQANAMTQLRDSQRSVNMEHKLRQHNSQANLRHYENNMQFIGRALTPRSHARSKAAARVQYYGPQDTKKALSLNLTHNAFQAPEFEAHDKIARTPSHKTLFERNNMFLAGNLEAQQGPPHLQHSGHNLPHRRINNTMNMNTNMHNNMNMNHATMNLNRSGGPSAGPGGARYDPAGGNSGSTSNKRLIPPPKDGTGMTSIPNSGEETSLTQYYRAFASRSKLGRTPVSSQFAERNEFHNMM